MCKEVAVFLDLNGESISFDEPGVIKIFKRDDEGWNVTKEFPFVLDKTMGIMTIREQLSTLVKALGDCRVVVGQKITGLPYTMLELMGCNIWELEGKPEDFLEFVLEREEKEERDAATVDSNTKEAAIIPFPHKINDEGCYSINLKQLQEHKGNFTSKQVLLPFLRNSTFYQLEIISSHIPPWFEREFQMLELEQEVIHMGLNEYKIIVKKKVCSG